jgi:hypothetical protein
LRRTRGLSTDHRFAPTLTPPASGLQCGFGTARGGRCAIGPRAGRRPGHTGDVTTVA